MLKKLALCVVGLAGLTMAQTATVEMNCVIDDTGEIWLNGQQIIRPKKAPDSTGAVLDTTSFPVTITQGENAIAIMVHDGGWTGGMTASIDYSVYSPSAPDTLVSDGTWKCMDRALVSQTGAQISSPTFDVSTWHASGDYGYLADDTGGHPKPFFARMGYEGANLFYHKAKWMWTPTKIFIRKSFTPAAATGSAMIRGNGFTFKMYLNGALVGEKATEQDYEDPLNRWDGRALNNGAENVVAIEAVCVDDIDFAFIKAAVQWSSTGAVRSDATWKYSWTETAGWNNTGFNDAGWVNLGDKVAYDAKTDALTAAKWIWATDLWFYKKFTVSSIGTIKMPGLTLSSKANVVRTQYFTLAGQQVSEKALSGLRSGTMVIQRNTLSNGTVRSSMVTVGR